MQLRPSVLLVLALLGGCAPVNYDPVLGNAGDHDGDGWKDFEEDDVGSDPGNPFNWDFGSGAWPDFTDEAAADGIFGTGFGIGDTMPEFLSVDQYGNFVPFYTFYGYVVILDFVAGWCVPCQEVAGGAQAMWVEHRLDGVLIMHLVVDDYEDDGVIGPAFQRRWADTYALDLPVMVDDDQLAWNGFWNAGLSDGSIPFAVVLDDRFTITQTFVGSEGAPQAEALAVELAGQRDSQ